MPIGTAVKSAGSEEEWATLSYQASAGGADTLVPSGPSRIMRIVASLVHGVGGSVSGRNAFVVAVAGDDWGEILFAAS